MNSLINITEATVIALHAMTLLVNEQNAVSAPYIAEKLGVSKHHLSKVLHTLVADNLLTSIKGPRGGFILVNDQTQTTFMQILEAIEGKPKCTPCLFAKTPCTKGKCILKNLLHNLNQEFHDYFNNTKLIDFKEKI